jgi:UDP-3-O-[3-hydroxymyristoyl] glucosamine N-acyltransferase
MKKISFESILDMLNCDYEIHGNGTKNFITNVKPVLEANEFSLIWINPSRNDKQKILKETKARIIICNDSLILDEKDFNKKVIIRVKNPKLAFINIVSALFMEKTEFGIHPSAVIHKDAEISSESYIGPLTYIGKVKIGKGTIIYGNIHICDNVIIGENVTIQAGCVIGSEGLNITKDDKGKWHQFPHVGGVIIEDDVRIDAMCQIDRGTLSNTIIGEGTKIDKCCYIAHNVVIGKNNVIIGHTMISGSVVVGNNCWFGPNSIIRDGIRIGNNVFIGMGSLVVADISEGLRVMGSPARPVDDMKKILSIINGLINDKT